MLHYFAAYWGKRHRSVICKAWSPFLKMGTTFAVRHYTGVVLWTYEALKTLLWEWVRADLLLPLVDALAPHPVRWPCEPSVPRVGCPIGTVYHVVLGEVLTAVVIRREPCLGSHDDVGVGDFQESEKFFLFVSVTYEWFPVICGKSWRVPHAGHVDSKIFYICVTFVASSLFALVSTDQSQLSFQMGHGNEVGSPDPTSSSHSRSRR